MSPSKYADKIDLFIPEERIGEKGLQIWGGDKIDADALQQFISTWSKSEMPFVIIETVREIAIKKNYDFSTIVPDTVERIRIFGAGGDLDIRRDANRFRWRYIGKKGLPEKVDGENFWANNSDKKFFMEEKDALLWGKYNSDRVVWHDNRVAKAKLSYPIDDNPKRVKIRYRTLSETGVIAFVWFVAIEGGKEDEQ
jgi:hypothetical protein